MNLATKIDKGMFIGLGLVTLATLMYENLLTRIFSVTMWYHFAFLAISTALFGMTVGAIIVYLFPNLFTPERVRYHLVLSTILFSITAVTSTLLHAKMRLIFDASLLGFSSLLANYVIIALPFVFSGICVSLALTKYPKNISKLYAADLIGAAIGCLAFIYVLEITDAMTAVFVVGAFAALGALAFSLRMPTGNLKAFTAILVILLVGFAFVNTLLSQQQRSLLRPVWVKGVIEPRPLFEKWNSFSRVAVWGDMNKTEEPFGWGISNLYPDDKEVRQLHLNIDASAETILTEFDGDIEAVDYLEQDVTNLAHVIRPESSVLIIGSGGGRDILSALAFNQNSITGVEINEDINIAVNDVFGDFTGHLDRNPKVNFITDEARSYIAGSNEKYDIIQVSLIDTWAATASGAYALSENSIYTVEAWKIFLDHLTSRGVMTFSRWYFPENPVETYRLTSLAVTSLREYGIQDPRGHIILVKNIESPENGGEAVGIGTMLVSKEPFTSIDLDLIRATAQQLAFDLVLTPNHSSDPVFAALVAGDAASVKHGPASILNLDPPTDDSPFFFLPIRLRDIFNQEIWTQGIPSLNMIVVYILGILLIVVAALTLLCILIPLLLTSKKIDLGGSLPFFLFFIAIGFGFMMIEISQMQRLIIFLGHPTYGLSVVLFSLLLSSGIGSQFSHKITGAQHRHNAAIWLLLLAVVLLGFGKLTPMAINSFGSGTTPTRILIAIGILFPIGFLMGIAFPVGMNLASSRSNSITPWLWGINGATSVLASVLAIVIALSAGISTAFWIGVGWYFVAWLAYLWASRGLIPIGRVRARLAASRSFDRPNP